MSCFSTLGKAWQSVKAELRYRSESHSKFAEQVSKKLRLDISLCTINTSYKLNWKRKYMSTRKVKRREEKR